MITTIIDPLRNFGSGVVHFKELKEGTVGKIVGVFTARNKIDKFLIGGQQYMLFRIIYDQCVS